MTQASARISRSTPRASASGAGGFTLLEMVATMAVLAIMSLGAISVLGIAAESQVMALDFAEVTDVGTITSNWLYTELREMRIPPSIGLQVMGPSDIQFTDWSGRVLRYTLVGTTLMRQLNGGAAQIFAEKVSSFQLVYRRTDGTVAASAYQVARVDFAITLTRNDVTRRFGGQVWPRSTAPYIANWREE